MLILIQQQKSVKDIALRKVTIFQTTFLVGNKIKDYTFVNFISNKTISSIESTHII